MATTLKPDLQRILKQSAPRIQHYEPARAGWDGPEQVRASVAAPNPVLETYGPQATARAVRAALVAAAIPDPKAVLAIGTLIVLMRHLRQQRDARKRMGIAAMQSDPNAGKAA